MTDFDGPGYDLAQDLAMVFRSHLPDYERIASVAPERDVILSELLKDQLGVFIMLVAYQRARAGEQGGNAQLVLKDYLGRMEISATARLPKFEAEMKANISAIDDLFERARQPRDPENDLN